MEKTITSSVADIASRTRWAVILHWYMLIAVGISGLFAIYIAEGLSERFFSNIFLLCIFILSNLIFFFMARAQRGTAYYRGIVLALITYEILFITLALYLNGGLESQIFILYAVPILMSIVTLQGYWVYLTAIGSAAIISGFLWADYTGLIESADKLTNLSKDYQYVLNTIVFIALTILLIAYLANYIIKLLQQKEREVTANLKALADAQEIARVGSWEWDIEKDRITWSNHLYKMFGLRSGKAINYEMYLERLHPDDRKLMSKTIEHSLKTGRPYKIIHRVVLSDNKILTLHGEGHVIKNAAGQPAKLVGIARDITNEYELEQAKDNFVSLASHQLRTPATEVRMLLSLLKDGMSGKLTKQQQELVEKAYQTNERQMRVANDLLGIAKLNAGRIKLDKKPLELGQWLSTIVQDIRPMLETKDQQFIFKTLKRPVIVKADAERLQLVVENLIENASKYTSTGGRVKLSYTTTGSRAIVSIQDNGVGIANTDQKKIFGIYTRIDNEFSGQVHGSGLGLYLVEKVVKLHNGKVEVKSKPRSGSIFRIHLPYSKK